MSQSDSDSFFREVSEEVRQDRLYRQMLKYGPWIAGAAIVAVGGVIAWEVVKAQATEASRAAGAAFLDVGERSAEDFRILDEQVGGDAAVLVSLELAAAEAAEGDREGAIARYRGVASDQGLPGVYRDLAALNAVRLEAATAEPDDLIAELSDLAAEGRPFRPLALELRAALYLNAGDEDAAHEDLSAVIEDPTSTRESRLRALQLLAASGGDALDAEPAGAGPAEEAPE